MPEQHPQFCDVSLPIPLDQSFTYQLPLTLRHRVQPGCRVVVPFGHRKLIGVAMRCHNEAPEVATKEALRLIDEDPVLDGGLLSLGQWISSYYCAPLGEVLKTMLPLAGETRRTKVYTLTDRGRDAARQLLLSTSSEEPAVELLRLLEARPLSAGYLKKKVTGADAALRGLQKKGLVAIEEDHAERDPMRAPAARLRAEFARRPDGEKLTKSERELLSYLELHPGSHNLATLEEVLPKASTAARSLGRRGLIQLRPEPPSILSAPPRPPHRLNAAQQKAFDRVRGNLEKGEFETFLLRGVTGSGKTEVYLRLIEATLQLGRNCLLLVPEIGLTPAVAGQFFHRFGDRVAILHSAFSGMEEWSSGDGSGAGTRKWWWGRGAGCLRRFRIWGL